MRSSLAQRVAPTGAEQACRPALRCGHAVPRYGFGGQLSAFEPALSNSIACVTQRPCQLSLCRCPQHQHVAACATDSVPQLVSRLAAAAETAEAEVAVPSAVTAAEQTAEPPAVSTESTASRQRKSRSSESSSDAQEAAGAIIVLDKPVTNSIVLRLAEVRQGAGVQAANVLMMCGQQQMYVACRQVWCCHNPYCGMADNTLHPACCACRRCQKALLHAGRFGRAADIPKTTVHLHVC